MWASFVAECMWAATWLSDKEETRQRLVMYHQFFQTQTLTGAVQARLTYLNTKEELEFCGTISEILRQRVQHANLSQHQAIDVPTGRPLRTPVHVFPILYWSSVGAFSVGKQPTQKEDMINVLEATSTRPYEFRGRTTVMSMFRAGR